MNSKELIKVGKYEFMIKENMMSFGEKKISHTFKIGGIYDNCIGISYKFNNNKYVSGVIPHATFEPECSTDAKLDKGEGTIIMLKSLLEYAYSKINTIKIFTFDDMSHIDCIEKDLSLPYPRKSVLPLNLAYLSIAYNSKTWYEKHFNATMCDNSKYKRYRERLDFLTNLIKKVDYIKFLEISQPNEEHYNYLERIYNSSKTYREFFELIPKAKRCDILRPWLVQFMEYYLKDVFSTDDWQIDVTRMNNTMEGGSKKLKIEKDTFYPANYKIISSKIIHTV